MVISWQKQLVSSLFLITIYSIFSYRLLLVDPPIHPDETYFANIAHHVMNEGIFRISLYDFGIGEQHIRAYGYPPFYISLLSIWMKYVGTSIELIRLLSVLVGALVLIIGNSICYSFSKSTFFSFVASLTVMMYGPFQMASRIARMEIMMLLCFCIGLYYLLHQSTNMKHISIAGVVSAVSWLTHPLGGLFCVIYAILIPSIVPLKSLKKSYIYFLFPILAGTVLWLLFVSDRFDLFIQQINLQLAYKANRESIVSLLFRTDILWRIRLLIILLINSFMIIWGLMKSDKTVVSLGIVGWTIVIGVYVGLEQWYLLYLLHPSLLGLAYVSTRKSLRVLSIFVLLILLLLNSYSTVSYVLQEKKTNSSYTAFVNKLTSIIPIDTRILVSTLPDPTIELSRLGYKHVYAVPHVTHQNVLKTVVDTYDVLLLNYVTNQELKEIINTHNFVSIPVSHGGYTTTIVFLHQ